MIKQPGNTIAHNFVKLKLSVSCQGLNNANLKTQNTTKTNDDTVMDKQHVVSLSSTKKHVESNLNGWNKIKIECYILKQNSEVEI